MTELSGQSHHAPRDKIVPGSVGFLLPNLECKVCAIYMLVQCKVKTHIKRYKWPTFLNLLEYAVWNLTSGINI